MAIIKSVNGKAPQWGKDCYFAENAAIVGDITMGNDCSVWFNAVLRADVAGIRMGNKVNVQDGACIHQSHGIPVNIEDEVSIGHRTRMHHTPRGAHRYGGRSARSFGNRSGSNRGGRRRRHAGNGDTSMRDMGRNTRKIHQKSTRTSGRGVRRTLYEH